MPNNYPNLLSGYADPYDREDPGLHRPTKKSLLVFLYRVSTVPWGEGVPGEVWLARGVRRRMIIIGRKPLIGLIGVLLSTCVSLVQGPPHRKGTQVSRSPMRATRSGSLEPINF